MKIKHRIWLLPIMTAAIVGVGIGAGSWVLIGSVYRSLVGEPELAVETVRSIASGDFTTIVKLTRGDETRLLHGIEALRQRLGSLIKDVRTTSSAVDSAAADISSGIERLTLRTSDQAASLEETAQSMEEMTVTLKRNSDNAHIANQLATEARDQAERRTARGSSTNPAAICSTSLRPRRKSPTSDRTSVAPCSQARCRARPALRSVVGSDLQWQEF